MHTHLYKRTYPIYINTFTNTHPQTHIYTHTYKYNYILTQIHLNSYKHMDTYTQANEQLCTITNTFHTPTHTR
jgi:hypothetical protein